MAKVKKGTETAERPLTPKQDRFVQEYVIDLNATQAAIRAGYAKGSAHVAGCRLLMNDKVTAQIQLGCNAKAKELNVDAQWVIEKLVANHDRAMQAEVVIDSEGNEIGEYRYNGAVANKSLELLMRHFGMFNDKVEIKGGLAFVDLWKLAQKGEGE